MNLYMFCWIYTFVWISKINNIRDNFCPFEKSNNNNHFWRIYIFLELFCFDSSLFFLWKFWWWHIFSIGIFYSLHLVEITKKRRRHSTIELRRKSHRIKIYIYFLNKSSTWNCVLNIDVLIDHFHVLICRSFINFLEKKVSHSKLF